MTGPWGKLIDKLFVIKLRKDLSSCLAIVSKDLIITFNPSFWVILGLSLGILALNRLMAFISILFKFIKMLHLTFSQGIVWLLINGLVAKAVQLKLRSLMLVWVSGLSCRILEDVRKEFHQGWSRKKRFYFKRLMYFIFIK